MRDVYKQVFWNREVSLQIFKRSDYHTFASVVTTGFGGNCTSVAFNMVFS